MIKFRQKDFSTLRTKIAYRTRKALSPITYPAKDKFSALLKLQEAGEKQPIRKALKTKSKKPTKYQIMKDTVRAEKESAKKAELLKFRAQTNPGGLVSDTAQYVVENPIAAGGTVAGYVPLATSGIYIPGTTPTAVGAEAYAKVVSPKYRRATSILGKTYKDTLGKVVEPATNAVVNTAKSLSGIY